MKTLIPFLLFVVGLSGCTEAHAPETTRPATCPLGVADARVQYEPTADGGALLFQTTAGQVDDLRERARIASTLQGPVGLGKGHDGHHGSGGRHGLQPMQLPPAYGGVEYVEGGVRLSFTPADPTDTDLLRAKLQTRARELMAGCS